MSEVVIELACLDDAEILYNLINDVYLIENGNTGEQFKTGTRYHSIDSIIAPLNTKNVYKAVLNNIIVGVIVWEIEENNEKSLFFGPLGVSKTHQGLGIGTKLMKFIEELAKEKNKTQLNMCVVNHRTSLIKSYEKIGFIATGVTEPYYEPQYLTRDSTFLFFSKPL